MLTAPLKSFAMIAVLATIMSFTNETNFNFIGTFGVTANDPAHITLTLNEDYTFKYQDFSNPKKKIDIQGNWEWNGKVLTFKNYTSKYPVHAKWRFTKNGQTAKSRKGMTFYTLCKLDTCK